MTKSDRQLERMAEQVRSGRVQTRTLLLALEEQLNNLARELPLAFPGEVGQTMAGVIEATANIIGMHALQHLMSDWNVLTDAERQQLLKHPIYARQETK